MLLVLFFLFNELVKRTNWYRNKLMYVREVQGKIESLDKQLSIVNLGSNPALFSFCYDDFDGQNWSTGMQGPEFDLDILKRYYTKIKKNGIVLIPIVVFSSITPYLWNYKLDYTSEWYHVRRYLINGKQTFFKNILNNFKEICWLRFPLLVYPRSFLYIVRDSNLDERRKTLEQKMDLNALQKDADKWVSGWMDEFDIKDINSPLTETLDYCQDQCADKIVEIINFCETKELKPVLVFPPMSSILNSRFTEKAKQTYVYSFVDRIKKKTPVLFMDYMTDIDFADPSLYFNSFFLNLHGRKKFTERMLKDLDVK